MVNDLQDLGTASLFTLDPNWGTSPKVVPAPKRRLIQYRGTATDLQSIGTLPVLQMTATYLINRVQKNYLMDFIKSHKARLNRFWYKHPKTYFTLQANAGTGATVIYVDRNEFDWQFQGYERFYIQMGNGDVITRKIDSVVENDPLDRLELNFLPALDRDINLVDNNTIGRLYLVRFDHDDYVFRHITQDYSEISIRVLEVIQEYGSV